LRQPHASIPAFLAALLVLGCAAERAPVLIGSAGPWDQSYGEMNKRGIDLAIDEINARGGVRGRPLQVVYRDDAGDGSKAAAVAGEFVANPAIVAVVGHVTSGAMVAAARVYDQGLPAISTTASSPDLSGISPWVFRVISSDSANGQDIARFVRRLGFRRASILYENNAYGRGLADAFRRGFGGDVLSTDPIPSDGDADYEPFVAFLRARQPDVVFVAGMQPSGTAILREARKQGLRSAFIGGDGWTPLALDTATADGAYVGAPFSAEDSRPEAQRFVQAFRARYHASPDGNAALGYDATMLLARAIAEAGTSRRAVRQWLTALGTEWSFPGVTGTIRFREGGDVVGKGFVMTQIRGGALIPVRLDGQS
jgi:branched-chain amino acid transport system substrate-binding protein